MPNKHYCPVCWRPVEATPSDKIFGHMNKINRPCEASYEPFHIVLTEKPPLNDVDFAPKIPKWWPKKRQNRAPNGQFTTNSGDIEEIFAI